MTHDLGKHDPCPCGCGELADECSEGVLTLLFGPPARKPAADTDPNRKAKP